jgi:sec-independent protein translocase protein TatC
MPDADPDQPPKSPPPGEAAPDAPSTELVGFRGLFGGSSDDDGDEGSSAPGGRRRKKHRSEMGFFDHLEELRMTVLKSAFAAAIGMGIVGLFFHKFLTFLQIPYQIALGPEVAANPLNSGPNPMGTVSMVISASIWGGVILMLPVIVYFVVRFVAPGLTLKEKGMLKPALASAMVLFFAGALTCFFIMLPAGLRFAFKLNETLGAKTLWSLQEYYSLVIWATLAVGLVFEFPLILVILQVLGVLSPDTLRGGRRYAIVVIAVVGGLIAPSPDVYSMLMMMAPMLILYEGAIIVGARLRKRRLAAEARRAANNSG